MDGFCIVSSDGDFTRLASRLRESGMEVIGMGENKTPRSFRAACSVFTDLELLQDQEDEEITAINNKRGLTDHTILYEFPKSKMLLLRLSRKMIIRESRRI